MHYAYNFFRTYTLFFVLDQIKKPNCFSGTIASVLKVPHYFFFYCFLKIKINQKRISSFITSLSVNNHAVPLGRCGSLRVSLCNLFIPPSISCLIAPAFSTFLLDIQPQHFKFYASVMKSNLLDVQRLSLSSFMTRLE